MSESAAAPLLEGTWWWSIMPAEGSDQLSRVVAAGRSNLARWELQERLPCLPTFSIWRLPFSLYLA